MANSCIEKIWAVQDVIFLKFFFKGFEYKQCMNVDIVKTKHLASTTISVTKM